MAELVKYEMHDEVATITMDDGKVNSLSVAMQQAVNDALDRAEQDKAIVVITGREGVFSAGFDLSTFMQGGEGVYDMLRGGADLALRVMTFPRPLVAACTGHVIAMGAFLSMCADVRIGAEGSFKYMCNEVAIGLTLPRFAIEIVRHRLRPADFNLALTTAHTYGPREAMTAGFLDRVVTPGNLADVAADTAARLTKLHTRAHEQSKQLVRERAIEALRDAIERELGSYDVFVSTVGKGMSVGSS